MTTAYRTLRRTFRNVISLIITIALSSHFSLVTMKYNRIQFNNVKINTKIRAAMLSIMILSTSTDSGLKQVGGEVAGDFSPRKLTLKKEFGSEFTRLTSKSASFASFLSWLFWLSGSSCLVLWFLFPLCLGWFSSRGPVGGINSISVDVCFILCNTWVSLI